LTFAAVVIIIQQKEEKGGENMVSNKAFGEFFKKKRLELRLTLREFCKRNNFDPGNISKIERGLLPPPHSDEKRRQYAKALKIKEGTDDWLTFFDLAAVCSGSLPSDIAEDEEVIKALPLLFRSIRKKNDMEEDDDLRNFIQSVRKELR